MMKLYWSPRSRSFSALWLMEETGQPYERVLSLGSIGERFSGFRTHSTRQVEQVPPPLQTCEITTPRSRAASRTERPAATG